MGMRLKFNSLHSLNVKTKPSTLMQNAHLYR